MGVMFNYNVKYYDKLLCFFVCLELIWFIKFDFLGI